MPKISVVIPCYFNEENIPVTGTALIGNQKRFGPNVEFEYVFIDDGSKDGTFFRLKEFKKHHQENVIAIRLTSNVGSYNAIYAGLTYATGDCVVVMSADLQDPPELIYDMFEEWQNGSKIVLANRKTESSIITRTFHGLLRMVALPNLPHGGFDFCLFDREAKDQLLQKPIPDINSLYLLLDLGHHFTTIPYKKQHRQIGKSRWTTKKKFRLAWKTVSYFLSERSKIVAYFWGRGKASGSMPYEIDEVA